MAEVEPARRVRFGSFEVDRKTGEVRRDGSMIRLRGQPVQVLLTLLARPGDLVTREELQKELWRDETFVDFEQSLNAAVKRLRAALGDDAEVPRFVETVPGRGYRFVAPVQPPASHLPATDVETTQPAGLSRTPAPYTSAPARRGGRWLPLAGVAATVVVIAALLLWQSRGVPQALGESDVILLTDFVNSTGDQVFDGTLRQALAVKLEESPFLSVFPEARVREALKLMRQPPDERLTAVVGRDLCQRHGLKALLAGEIAAFGARYALTLNAVNCQTGDSLAREYSEANNKEDVLRALDLVASGMRRKLGESLASIERLNTPIHLATTASLDALRAYALGQEQYMKSSVADAIPSLKRAIELDPDFAEAHAALGAAYYQMGETEVGREHYSHAFERRHRVSEREKLFIAALYYQGQGDLDKTTAALELWERTYPRETSAAIDLAAISRHQGNFERSAEQLTKAIRLDPENAIQYASLCGTLALLMRLDEAKASCRDAITRGLDDESVHHALYWIAFLQGDTEEMKRHVEWAEGGVGELALLEAQAAVAGMTGRLEDMRRFTTRATERARRAGLKEFETTFELGVGLVEAAAGNPANGLARTKTALALSQARGVRELAAITLIVAGDAPAAGALADELAAQAPMDTLLNFSTLPTVRAGIALGRGRNEEAVQLLSVARFERVRVAAPYLRGVAYLASGRGQEAASEFRKVVANPAVAPFPWLANFAYFGPAYVGIARAEALTGNRGASRAAYEQFFAFWNGADPDLGLVRTARAEYERLK